MAVNIILDGNDCTCKSILDVLYSLESTRSRCVNEAIGAHYLTHKVIVQGVEYKTSIWDARKLRISVDDDVNWSPYLIANVILEMFSVDQPDALKHIIEVRIPQLRSQLQTTPFLLVGVGADITQERLFSTELCILLMQLVSEVKYCKFSVMYTINELYVHNLLKEAVCESLQADDECTKEYSVYKSHLTEDQQNETSSKLCEKNSCFRIPEIERFKLSNSSQNFYIRTEDSLLPSCYLWYIPDTTDPVSEVYQSACVERLSDEDVSKTVVHLSVNLRFFKITCESIIDFLFYNQITTSSIRSLVIVKCFGILDFSFLAALVGVEYLVIVDTDVDITTLKIPSNLCGTIKHLVLDNCGITKAKNVPSEIGKLKNLQLLNLNNNNFKKLPTSMSFLQQLQTLLIDRKNVVFPPAEVMRKSARDVIKYLEAIQEDPAENKEAKLIVVGKEGVGKSTLIKAMKRDYWITKNKPPDKTDGVDISILPLGEIQCKVYDLAGDVEYLNTHSLFLSSNCLNLAVFDMSQLIVSKGSSEHFSRLELWLQTIASQCPKSFVILVGTHADHPIVSKQIIMKNRKILVGVLTKYRLKHIAFSQTDPCEACIICNPEKAPANLDCLGLLKDCEPCDNDSHTTTSSLIPHILGYYEVSGIKMYPRSRMGFRNINVEDLKSRIASSVTDLMKATKTEKIPRNWLTFRDTIVQKLSSDNDLKQQPVLSLSKIVDIAVQIHPVLEEKIVAMLRFFRSQGTFLWYEDLPEMKDIVIMDPQWLSDQLRTLISHSSSVSSISDGVLCLSELPTLWAHISEENRSKLLCLFRSVGLCFKITETEELFPCNLPVGWPDREMWSPLPNRSENQTCLLFGFSYVPPSLFPDLIVEVNKKREVFAKDVKPLYYRFHIVYITKSQAFSAKFNDQCPVATATEDDACLPAQDSAVLHTVHYELMPYTNSLTVSIRGPHPRSIIPDIRYTLETVKCRRYPGITYYERLLCPECVMKKIQSPASFKLNCSHDGVCSWGHKVGGNDVILEGKFDSGNSDSSAIGQAGRVVGETLQEHVCPKLFVVLPINLECASLKDRFVYSYLRDGFAVHLLCECPDQWHFVDSPGFRVGKPKQFFEKYGNRVCKVLRFLSTISTPFKAAAALDPLCKTGAAVSVGAKSACKELQSLLENYLDKYPHLKSSLGSSKDDVKNLKSSSGLQRSELSRFLEIEATGHNFGPLVCTYVDKCNQWLWLCEEHNKRFEIVEREAVCE